MKTPKELLIEKRLILKDDRGYLHEYSKVVSIDQVIECMEEYAGQFFPVLAKSKNKIHCSRCENEVIVADRVFGYAYCKDCYKKLNLKERLKSDDNLNQIMLIIDFNKKHYDNELSSIDWLAKSAFDIYNYFKAIG